MAAFRRRREEAEAFIVSNELVSMPADRAREVVKEAGFRFRCLDLDQPGEHLLSLDLDPNRITVEVRDGHVVFAEAH